VRIDIQVVGIENIPAENLRFVSDVPDAQFEMPDEKFVAIAHIDGSVEPVNPGGSMSIGWWYRVKGSSGVETRSDFFGKHPKFDYNYAVYAALFSLLEELVEKKIEGLVLVQTDSKMLALQMKGKWAAHHGAYIQVRDLVVKVLEENKQLQFEYDHIPKEELWVADGLSRLPLKVLKIPQNTYGKRR
jgi:ribonuclease HI